MGNFPKIDSLGKEKSILSIDQLDKPSILKLFKKVPIARKLVKSSQISKTLKGKVIALMFFEPSSRTFSSFATAVKRLGGETLEFQNLSETSSVKKGESFADTIRTFATYSNAIIIRHPKPFSAYEASLLCNIPVINAGDGGNEHPTQTLLDLYTINEHVGSLEKLKIVACGDILHSRTIRSLIEGLSLFKGNTIFLLSTKELRLEQAFFKKMLEKGIKLVEINKEQDIPKDADVWYWNRVQKERFANQKDAARHIKKFVLTPKLLETYGNKKMIIMDPLPRVGEIEIDVDSDPRAMYFKNQIENGVYVRMALLSLVLEK